METTKHTLKLNVGRAGPLTSSAGTLSPGDDRRIRDAAGILVAQGGSDAAVCFVMPSGRSVLLRRMRTTHEVRGIIDPPSIGRKGMSELLGRDSLWASPAFAEARMIAVRVAGDGHTAPTAWCSGFAAAPAGFVPLEPEPDRSRPDRGAEGPCEDRRRRGQTASDAGLESDAHAADWPILCCAALTIASAGFLMMSVLAARNAP